MTDRDSLSNEELHEKSEKAVDLINEAQSFTLEEVLSLISYSMSRALHTALSLTSLLSASSTYLLRPHLLDIPLSTFPMLQAHDAGTVYLDRNDPTIDEVIYRFTITQDAFNITQLLDCGVRAFDWRPSLTNDLLGFAHGSVFINHSMQSAVNEVVTWANEYAKDAEDALVILVVADCNSQECNDLAETAFKAEGLPVIVGNDACAVASDFTLGSVMSASQLAGGGHAIAIMNCPSSSIPTYDDTLSCTGYSNTTEGAAFESAIEECISLSSPQAFIDCVDVIVGIINIPAHYACYLDGSGKNSSIAFDRLQDYLIQTAKKPLPIAPGSRGLLTSLEGCWAQNDASTILSFLHNSSLVLDESRANFNKGFLLDTIRSGNSTHPRLLENINLVGVNGACDGGLDLLLELRKRIVTKQ